MRKILSVVVTLSLATISLGALSGCSYISSVNGDAAQSAVALPDGFPSDFPIASGTIISAETINKSSFAVTVKVKSADDQQAAIQQLTDAGYTQYGHNQDGATETYAMTNGVTVATVVLSQDDNYEVAYTISPLNK